MTEEEFVLMVLQKTIGPMLLITLFSLAGSVFLALCVYNDAKIRGNDNAVMWAVLSGFFNIVALIYIIVAVSSKSKPVACMRCHNLIPPGYVGCPVCGLPLANRTPPPEMLDGYKNRRTVFLILFIAFTVISILAAIWWVADFSRFMLEAPIYY